MHYYTVLAIATFIIVILALLLWVKTKSISFPLGIAFMYFLSLYGGWFIIYDKLGGDSGMHYGYLEGKLFPVYLDDNYFWSLVLYALFIIVVELTVILLVRPRRVPMAVAHAPVEISHALILAITGMAGIFSYLLIRAGMQAAAAQNVAAYELMKRGFGEVPPLFTLHQVLFRMGVSPAALGFVVMCSGKNPRLIAGKGCRFFLGGYLVVIGGMLWLAFILGYKSELFFPGLAAGLFYLANAERPKIAFLSTAGFFVLIGMGLIDLLRFVPMAELSRINLGDLADSLKLIASSNEAFSGHFSMYGVLTYDVPITYGYSLLSLVASIVPRVLWANRPQDIYFYYADSVNATEGQGYTINHAAGWYLNFGVVGIVLGAILLGFIWAKCFNNYANPHAKWPRWYYIFAVLSPWLFTAYIPTIMRVGPEIYKGLFVEGFFVPVATLIMASYKWRLIPRPIHFRLIQKLSR